MSAMKIHPVEDAKHIENLFTIEKRFVWKSIFMIKGKIDERELLQKTYFHVIKELNQRFEWVEIIEPSRHEHMFANLKTGQCLWDAPEGVPVKPTHENQWWELFDTNTGRYYYYNATSQETVWRKPKDGDIIPLSKLQMLKTRESSSRESSIKKLRNEFENNNDDNVKSESVRYNENKKPFTLGQSEDKSFTESLNNKDSSHSSKIRNVNRPYLNSEMRSLSQSSAVSNTNAAQVLIGKRASFPRTMTAAPSGERPAIKDKPKSNSLRSKAPPKPPRMMVNVSDLRGSNNLINISVEKTLEKTSDIEETNLDTQKENLIPCTSNQVSVQRSPKMSQKSIEKPKGPPPPAPTALASLHNAIDQTSSLDALEKELALSGHYSQIVLERPNNSITKTNSFRSKDNIFSNSALNEVNHSLESTNISRSDYAVPVTSVNSVTTISKIPSAYDVPAIRNALKTEQFTSEKLTNNYTTPLPVITDSEIEHVLKNNNSIKNDSSKTNSISVVISPEPSSDLSTSHSSDEPVLTPREYDLINEITMNNHDIRVLPSPEFPKVESTIPVPPPLPPSLKYSIRKQHVPSLYDNVDPSMYENSSENEELNGTFNSIDDSMSPRACNMSASSDEAFDPSESNLLGSDSPDGNYYDNRIDGMERRSCATLPSPRASPRKLPNTQLKDGRGTPPAKRNTLVRMKSDPLVEVEKRAKISKKTIESIQSTFRPISMLNLSNNLANITNKHKRSVLGSESDIPEQVPLSTHRTGILRRRMSIHSMLSWSKSCIKKPMVLTRDKSQRKEAVDVFKLILMCMGDKSTRKSHETICVDIVTRGWTTPQIRDEIYIQLCKQTTGNKKINSLRQGWELITACLSIFPPSNKFHSYLEGYISRHLDNDEENIVQANVPQYAKYCYKQLERICQTGAKRGLKGPTIEEINAAIKRVFNPSMFGNTLEDVMEMQKDRYPGHRLPWILTTLTESVLLQNGLKTEGIFRVPGDIDDVNQLKLLADNWQTPEHKSDPTVPASLLKLWFRDLYEPLIPQRFYDQCIHNCDNPEISLNIIHSLPPLNRLIFSYLIRLLQAFIIPENVSKSKMDENNLSMVWAPNCLRCPSDDPREIFENTRKEMTFLRNVLKVLDTSFLEGVV